MYDVCPNSGFDHLNIPSHFVLSVNHQFSADVLMLEGDVCVAKIIGFQPATGIIGCPFDAEQ